MKLWGDNEDWAKWVGRLMAKAIIACPHGTVFSFKLSHYKTADGRDGFNIDRITAPYCMECAPVSAFAIGSLMIDPPANSA